ncbi:MAG: nitrilase family protein, partial [Prevotella sp.]|nr:nitrilase family protein [Prevotella sp.]
PCFSRNKSKPSTLNSKLSTPYDLCIYVASWPESRRAVWDILLRARAIENQCYVIGVNRIGDDPVCHYNGGTTIISPYGKVDATAPDDAIAAITSPLDLERLHAFRMKFPVLNDADSISLK